MRGCSGTSGGRGLVAPVGVCSAAGGRSTWQTCRMQVLRKDSCQAHCHHSPRVCVTTPLTYASPLSCAQIILQLEAQSVEKMTAAGKMLACLAGWDSGCCCSACSCSCPGSPCWWPLCSGAQAWGASGPCACAVWASLPCRGVPALGLPEQAAPVPRRLRTDKFALSTSVIHRHFKVPTSTPAPCSAWYAPRQTTEMREERFSWVGTSSSTIPARLLFACGGDCFE